MNNLVRNEKGEITILVLGALYLISMLVLAISKGNERKQNYLNNTMAKSLIERFESVSTDGKELSIQLKSNQQCFDVKEKMIDMSRGNEDLEDIEFKLSCENKFLTYKH